MGLNHDDIIISKSILEPITTLFSIGGLLAVLFAAFFLRKRAPIVMFCVTWYLIGHSIESMIVPLRIAFEHRNYLPQIGIVFGMSFVIISYAQVHKKLIIMPFLIVASFGSYSTTLNSSPETIIPV